MRRLNACVTGIVFSLTAHLPAAEPPQIADLLPTKVFSLSQSINNSLWQKLQVREMRSSPDELWFLVDSMDPRGASAIVGTDNAGWLRAMVTLGRSGAIGLTATARGVATIAIKQRQMFLTEYGVNGSELWERQIPCGSAEGLITIDGKPSVACEDGTITTYDGENPPVQTPSWARAGSKFEVMPPH